MWEFHRLPEAKIFLDSMYLAELAPRKMLFLKRIKMKGGF